MWLLTALVLLLLAAVAYFGWQLRASQEDKKELQKDKQQLQ